MRPALGLGTVGLLLAGAVVGSALPLGPWQPVPVALAWVLFALALWLVRRVPTRLAVGVILAGGILIPLAAAAVPPSTSDDVFRYVWDGRVAASGVDPYAYPPAATPLTGLRDPALWPDQAGWCVGDGDGLTAGCTRINRPWVPTIYPPVAQAYFLLVHALAGGSTAVRPFQLAGALLAIATTLLLLRWARSRPDAGDPRPVLAWAWCPAVAFEAVTNAHVDSLAVLLAGGALILAARSRPRWAGIMLGLAVATKVTPVLLAPALARRRPIVLGLTALFTILAVYVPHVVAVGPKVIGYLPGYLGEEGYASGTRFALLSPVLPGAWASGAAVVILAGVAVLVARRTDPDQPWLGAATMVGTALLVTTPAYSWYALLLVLLVGLGARPAWLAVAAAGDVAIYAHHLHLGGLAQLIGYGLALIVVARAPVTERLDGRATADRIIPAGRALVPRSRLRPRRGLPCRRAQPPEEDRTF